ncbi:DUF1206 domain-containing protein [Streptomyces sp. NRRL S-350]|uniref:DUF1206 domain-containing protein n=1 Tax=Streptomyces sp. NRRL S-350 TaxID=1463902 RepID=UPI00056B75D5|nr:DUF1206 domain-containing protein [Streptomyces sp. NRRL S-350]
MAPTHAQLRGAGDGRRSTGAARRRSRKETVRTAGRAGFVARGVVYTLIGVLAVRIAFGHGGGDADRQGALRQVAAQPFGAAMLWALAVGFACMALWRAALAIAGRGDEGKTGKRVLNAGRALFYASVCWGTAAYAAGNGTGSDSDSASQDWTAAALRLPAGRVLVAVAGLVVVGIGVGIAVNALRRRFLRRLDTAAMGRSVRTGVTALGVGGNLARGVILAGAGVFALVAAIHFDPHRAKGMDDTLRSFSQTPAGPWLLVLVALGLVLFGGFSFASVRWRRF